MKKVLLVLIFIALFIVSIPKDEIKTYDENIINKIKFEIKGAVNNPGVYEIESGKRVNDAIELSGGLLKNADISNTNLSKNITDEMVIIIYTKEEIASMTTGNTTIKYIDKECICPVIENNSCIENKITNFEVEESNKISLNKATLEELMTLKGIGESKAKAIIEYREKTPFKSIEEITNVKGIGKAMFEKIKDNISI